MSDTVLEYIGLNINRISKYVKAEKPKYTTAKAFDNAVAYRVYKKIPIKSIEILISKTDRTTDIKERYQRSIPIDQYIKENKEEFVDLANKTSIDAIKKLEDLQNSFEKQIPYFVKFDKNYIWQIFYSRAENKYFMLFPINEGETEVLFYMLKEKIANNDKYIYVPICKEECEGKLISTTRIKDLENYLWMFTSIWPQIYEVTDEKNKTKLYIIGKIIVQNDFKTKYRIELKDEKSAEEQYTLFKALFIIMTETKYIYKFYPEINDKGSLILTFNGKEIDIKNMKEFTSRETARQQNKKYELKRLSEKNLKQLEKIKEIIEEQNKVYSSQEKQIAIFMSCRKSFFKRVKFFFTNNKKFTLINKKNMEKIEKEVKETEQNESENIYTEIGDTLEITDMFTISDLVKTALQTKKESDTYKNILADIKAQKIKQKNMKHKIENAQIYLDEIEEHKKSWLGFWRFTNKDNENVLTSGQDIEEQSKRRNTFSLNENFDAFAEEVDNFQRKKLSIEECDALFVARYLLPGINSVITRSDTYILDEEYEQLEKEYKQQDHESSFFGNYADESTKVKTLNNKKFRENRKNLFAILKFNEYTSLDDFKERMRATGVLVNEAYQKLVAQYNMTVYYSKRNKGYIIGDIDPYKLLKDESVKKLYKMNTGDQTHIIYLSNIIFYENRNKTLPVGMDESTEFITKVGENRKISDSNIKLLIEKDLFNVEIRKIKLIEEGKRN